MEAPCHGDIQSYRLALSFWNTSLCFSVSLQGSGILNLPLKYYKVYDTIFSHSPAKPGKKPGPKKIQTLTLIINNPRRANLEAEILS
jgi:hypothetical protein